MQSRDGRCRRWGSVPRNLSRLLPKKRDLRVAPAMAVYAPRRRQTDCCHSPSDADGGALLRNALRADLCVAGHRLLTKSALAGAARNVTDGARSSGSGSAAEQT